MKTKNKLIDPYLLPELPDDLIAAEDEAKRKEIITDEVRAKLPKTITYEFADGTVSEVEIPDEFQEKFYIWNRLEKTRSRAFERNTLSLDAMVFDGESFGKTDGIVERYIHDDLIAELKEKLLSLTDLQRNRFTKWASGMTVREIAAEEHCSIRSIMQSIEQSRRILKNIF